MTELIVRTPYGSDCVYFEGDTLPDGVLPNFTGGVCVLDGTEVTVKVLPDRRLAIVKSFEVPE